MSRPAQPQHPGTPPQVASPIIGTGEMAELTRDFDWSATPVGPVDTWPDTLLNTVSLMLGNRQPMFLWWGEELTQFYNDAYRPSLGSDKHPKALGQPGPECWPEIWHVIGPQIEAVMSRGESCWYEDQLVPIYREGVLEDVYWTYSYSPVRDPNGRIRGTLVICSETTRRVTAEHQLGIERQRLLDLFVQAPAFVAVLRGPGHLLEFANPLYQELIGDRKVVGKPLREAVPEAEEQGFTSILDTVYQTGERHVAHGSRIMLARRPGYPLETRYLDFIYQPIREPDGSISGIIVLGIDVTERNRAEQSLLQAEKLAAVGRLAASIAHEINNPLEAVTNLLYLVEHTDEKAQRLQFLDAAQQELRRVARITTQTLRFHRQSTKKAPVALADVMESVVTLLGGQLRNAGLRVERQYRTPGEIVGYDGDLRQVFVNLLDNAIDASHDGGQIVLRIRESSDHLTGAPGIRALVGDTGTGMPKLVLDRIFEPFFTTKETTGTGLGLWVSKDILDKHDAKIRVRTSTSEENHGTIFSIFFPHEAVR